MGAVSLLCRHDKGARMTCIAIRKWGHCVINGKLFVYQEESEGGVKNVCLHGRREVLIVRQDTYRIWNLSQLILHFLVTPVRRTMPSTVHDYCLTSQRWVPLQLVPLLLPML